MRALDAFSSPHGSDPLDGASVRGMAQNILNMVTNRPHPIRPLYIIFDVVILALTIMMIISLTRISKRYKKLKQQGIAKRSVFVSRLCVISVLHFAWPLFVLYLVRNVLLWKVLVMLQPDLVYWLEAIAIIVFLKGVLEIAFTSHVFRQTQPNPHPV